MSDKLKRGPLKMSTIFLIILDCSSPEFKIILFFSILSKCRHFNKNAEKLLFHLVTWELGQGKRFGSSMEGLKTGLSSIEPGTVKIRKLGD